MANTINIILIIQMRRAMIKACMNTGTRYIHQNSIDSDRSLYFSINECNIELSFCKYMLN